MVDAIARTDRKLKRSDPRYEAALINNIYDRRAEDFRASSERERAAGDRAKGAGDRDKAQGKIERANAYYKMAKRHYATAKGDMSIVNNRYPQERAEALLVARARR